MKILSLVNQKGGCGKTTTAVNLASALSNQGWRVLLIDLDPQAHATFHLGLTPKQTLTDLFEKVIENIPFSLDDFLIPRGKNMSVLASSIGLSTIEQRLSNREDKLDILAKILISADAGFDYCIIDCPPNLGILTLNALVTSGYCIVPLTVCDLSLKGVENLNNILTVLFEYKKRSPSVFYLLTQLDRRFKFSQTFITKLNKILGKQLLSSVIRTNIHLREAASSQTSIYDYKKDSRGAADYTTLCDEISKKVNNASWIPLFFKGKEIKEIYVVGEFNSWQKSESYKLKKLNIDTWFINLPLKKGTYRYKFVADEKWINDPVNALKEDDAFGGINSVLLVS
ncbi:MAG: AAA family ATPase [Candidatus Omnitrophota bacterium]